jgi:hypothetical protein
MVSAMPYIQTCKGKYTKSPPKLHSKQWGIFNLYSSVQNNETQTGENKAYYTNYKSITL